MLLLVLSFSSCSREPYVSDDSISKSERKVTLDKARDYFDSLIFKTKGGIALGDSSLTPSVINPNWSASLDSRDDIIEVVEVPIFSNYGVYAVRDSIAVKAEQRIAFFDNTYFPGLNAYVVTIVPTIDYYKHHSDKIPLITRAGEKYGFEGVVLVHTFRGEFVELNRYFKGERDPGYYIYAGRPGSWNDASLRASIDWAMDGFCLVKAVESSPKTKIQLQKLPTEGDYECFWINDTYECFCRIGNVVIRGNNSGGGGGGYGGTIGGPGGTIDGGGGAGSGSGGGGGSGSGSGGYNPPYDPNRGNPPNNYAGEILSSIDKVFNNLNLVPIHARKINAALASLQSRCMSKGLVNMMANSNITIRYGTMTDPKVLAQFEGVSTGSYLNVNPEAFNSSGDDLQNAILHELFHAYHFINYYGNGTNIGYQTYKLASEFMAYTFVNLHYGYSMKGTDHVIPPIDLPWMKQQMEDMSVLTEQYSKRITQTQLEGLFKKYEQNYRDYVGQSPVAGENMTLTPLVNLMNTVLNSNDCMYFK